MLFTFLNMKYVLWILFVVIVISILYFLNTKDIIFKLLFDSKKHFQKKHQNTLNQIKNLEEKYMSFTDEELKNTFMTTDDIANSFAILREGVKRVAKVRIYDVQILGTIALNSGAIAEMKTGEGKTLVAGIAAIYNARAKKGVHVVSVNDYLAKRDAMLIEPIANFFEFSVGYVLDSSSYHDKKQAYNCDITYGSNNQIAFDYLRDNMVTSIEEKLLPMELYCAIVDEADNILIDEARTPLIISDVLKEDFELYVLLNDLMLLLTENIDYTVDHKNKNATFTNTGLIKLETALLENNIIETRLFAAENLKKYHVLRNLLKAHFVFTREIDYDVIGNEVIIIDEFTGRLAKGRRFSHGLHSALEAKERVNIKEGSVTKAWTTYPCFFLLYNKLCGLTGTAEIDSEEFLETYNLPVIPIETNKPIIRKDHKDIHLYCKYNDMLDDIIKIVQEKHRKQQPLLICSASVKTSHELSYRLHTLDLPHNLLNAKNEEYEANIVAQAGRPGQITVSTNMAGRGTDIIIGGRLYQEYDHEAELEEAQKKLAEDRSIAFHAGGLCVLIVEAQDSKKSEVQFAGRAGRQGEPGESMIFYSLEDDLLRPLYQDQINVMMLKYYFPYEKQKYYVTKKAQDLVNQIQHTFQMHYFETRKQQLKYDQIINHQRLVIYKFRDQIMQFSHDECRKLILNAFNMCMQGPYKQDIMDVFLADESNKSEDILSTIEHNIEKRKDELNSSILSELDALWYEHIIEIDTLKSTIHLSSYEQKDPLQEYQIISYKLFRELLLIHFSKNVVLMILTNPEMYDNFEDLFNMDLQDMNLEDLKEQFFKSIKNQDDLNKLSFDLDNISHEDQDDNI